MGFPKSDQPRSCVTPNFPKKGFSYSNLSFFAQLLKKPLKVWYKVSLSKNFQRQSCSVINYLSNGVNTLARDDPVLAKSGPKGMDPNRKDARLTFRTRRAVQSATADLLVMVFMSHCCSQSCLSY